MKNIAKPIALVAFLCFAGAFLLWINHGQNRFGDEVRRFIASGVTKMEICNECGGNAINCKAVQNAGRFTLITSALAANVPKITPGHAPVTFERLIKLYGPNAMLCFRAVEFQHHEGVLYLESVAPDQTCSTFKYASHSLMVKGLNKSVLEKGG